MKYAVPVNLQGNDLQNAAVHRLSGAPSAPVQGQIYFNTSTSLPYIWNGSTWRCLDVGGAPAGSIPISALDVDPRARSSHTGTQAAATISDLAAVVKGYRLDEFATPTAPVDIGSQRLINVATPTAAADAAPKSYVDSVVQQAQAGIDAKPSVRVVASSNITLSGTQTIDGVAVVAGNRVLCRAQTTASQNGVYVVAAGAWARATDADATGEITPGALWFVEEGTAGGKRTYVCSNTGTVTLGTTAITIVPFAATNDINAGAGLALSDNTLAVQASATKPGVTVDASGVGLDAARVAFKKTLTITGNGALTSFTVAHNMNATALIVVVSDTTTGEQLMVDWSLQDLNTIVISVGTPLPATGTFSSCRVTVIV